MYFTTVIENRYRLMFRFYDLNKDGLLDSKDFEILIDNVAEVLETDGAENAKAESRKWWGMFDKLGLQGPITEQQFICAIRFLFEKDFQKFRRLCFRLYETNFHVVDHDKDNRISLDELVKFYACFNITDTARVKKIFDKLDLDKDGFVTRDEWIMAQIDFSTRDDPDHDFGFIMDFSSRVPENRSSGRLTPNLLKRYKTTFRFYDVNKDGTHMLDDYLLICDSMCNLYNGSEDERAALHHTAHTAWKQLEPMAVDGKITEEHYVYLIITNLVTNFDQMRLEVFHLSRTWFNVADHDGDGVISEDEFLKFYAAHGTKDTDKVQKIFKQVDQDDDRFIRQDEWILANLDYWTRDDPTYDYGFLYDVE